MLSSVRIQNRIDTMKDKTLGEFLFGYPLSIREKEELYVLSGENIALSRVWAFDFLLYAPRFLLELFKYNLVDEMKQISKDLNLPMTEVFSYSE